MGKAARRDIMIVWSNDFRCIEFEGLDMQRMCSDGDINLEFEGKSEPEIEIWWLSEYRWFENSGYN